MNLILKIFARAKFIHIMRDPFDACLSLLEKYQGKEFHIDIYFAARNWVRRISDIHRSRACLNSDLYFELFYEDLVHQPEIKLREICGFIGEQYETPMLEQHVLAQQSIPPDSYFFENVRKPINTASIGRGRRELSLPDQRIIQHVAGPLMTQLGYQVEVFGAMSVEEKLRVALLKMKYELLQTGRKLATDFNLMPPI